MLHHVSDNNSPKNRHIQTLFDNTTKTEWFLKIIRVSLFRKYFTYFFKIMSPLVAIFLFCKRQFSEP